MLHPDPLGSLFLVKNPILALLFQRSLHPANGGESLASDGGAFREIVCLPPCVEKRAEAFRTRRAVHGARDEMLIRLLI